MEAKDPGPPQTRALSEAEHAAASRPVAPRGAGQQVHWRPSAGREAAQRRRVGALGAFDGRRPKTFRLDAQSRWRGARSREHALAQTPPCAAFPNALSARAASLCSIGSDRGEKRGTHLHSRGERAVPKTRREQTIEATSTERNDGRWRIPADTFKPTFFSRALFSFMT